MRTRFVLVGCLTLLGSGALAAALSVTAVAQPALPRVVQTSDGSLYVVRGANAWPLVPDQIDDAELGTLTLGAEVDGTLPASVLTAAAPVPVPEAPPADAADTADTAPSADTATPVPNGPAPAPPLRRGVPPATPAPGTAKQSVAGPTPTPAPYRR